MRPRTRGVGGKRTWSRRALPAPELRRAPGGRDPLRALPEERELGAGPRAAGVAALVPRPLRAKGLRPWAPSRASLLHIPARAASTGRGRGRCSAPAPFARCSGSLHSCPSLCSSQHLSRRRQQDPKPRKERKSEGAGALRTRAPSQPSGGKTAALLLAARGGEGEVGRGPASPRGLARRAGSGGGCFTARGGAGGGSPRGARPPGGGQMLARSSPRAPSFLKYCKVLGDPPGTHSRAENSGDRRCGVRGGEAGEGRGFFSGSRLRGRCAGGCEPRQQTALSLKGRDR